MMQVRFQSNWHIQGTTITQVSTELQKIDARNKIALGGGGTDPNGKNYGRILTGREAQQLLKIYGIKIETRGKDKAQVDQEILDGFVKLEGDETKAQRKMQLAAITYSVSLDKRGKPYHEVTFDVQGQRTQTKKNVRKTTPPKG